MTTDIEKTSRRKVIVDVYNQFRQYHSDDIYAFAVFSNQPIQKSNNPKYDKVSFFMNMFKDIIPNQFRRAKIALDIAGQLWPEEVITYNNIWKTILSKRKSKRPIRHMRSTARTSRPFRN